MVDCEPCWLAACLACLIRSLNSFVKVEPLLPEDDRTVQYSLRSMLIFYFMLAGLDRVNLHIAAREAELLENQYQGSIRQASCSQIQDEMNTRSEIGNQVDKVDKVIEVLLKAGMTSDALRDAHMHGVVLRHSGVVQLAIPLIVLGPFVIESF
ncbi:unnamed protein product [Durusdinium trenchii]|uniref:Uncharacterized protein n=1 Tax=Durusdinium trenchii TaxID=1381693 RepID=A0ABP0QS08_9DINO